MLTVVNVGGDLARAPGDDALAALCQALGEAAGRSPIVIVPGGGGFTAAVRDAETRFELGPAARHRLALLAMDQFGCVLGDLIPDAVLCHTVARARAEAEAGRAAVLLPGEQLLGQGTSPEAWPVTSDSIAVWVAGAVGGARAVLLRAVDGAFPGWPADPAAPARLSDGEHEQLPRRAGADGDADADVAHALHAAGVDTWIVSGHDADRLVEILCIGEATGPLRGGSDEQ
jgi:5-(aminomethyl)-3-furanmethanol phosphate kinase